jgi:hypothetical protein
VAAELRRYDRRRRREEPGHAGLSPKVVAIAQDGGTGYYLTPEDPACNVVWACLPPYALHRLTRVRFGRARPSGID